MPPLDDYLDRQLARGRIYFTREDALRNLHLTPDSLTAALSRLARKGRQPAPGLLPDPAARGPAGGRAGPRAMDPRADEAPEVGLPGLAPTAAKVHGATNEAPAFQLIVPRQLRDFGIGRHRVEFVAQAENTFIRTNRPEWTAEMKPGAAKVAGVELTLLDCARYFHRAGGISAVAQIARDLGGKALARRLTTLARACESSAVRRLGYLLELAGHEEQAKALDRFAEEAKSVKLLDPTSSIEPGEMSGRWKIAVNTPKC